MEPTTEALLAQHQVVAVSVIHASSLPDHLGKPQLVAHNPHCLIRKVYASDLAFENIALMAQAEFMRLLREQKLGQLQSLDLSRNHITTLPAEIGSLTNLTTLTLFSNRLSTLPPTIGQLTRLTKLDLFQNRLTVLPKELQQCKNLKNLDLRRNPLPIPDELLAKVDEPAAILTYYWTLKFLGLESKPINASKVLIVGQGAVGKTSLINRLLHNTFQPTENKTEGIAIAHWEVANQAQGENHPANIQLNLWDFGGQEIMHATHQFFLTKRSLYLLVVDARATQEENRVEYWLKIIQSFGGEAPVLLVGNKIDQHPLDIDRNGLQKKYPNLVGILETSAATGAGMAALEAAITEQINALPHIRDLLPETWFTTKTKLEALGREHNYITHDRYLELCAAHAVNDEVAQRTLIGFLHDLGVILHFQDDARLAALGILNPQWVTNGVYKILNARALYEHKGLLQRPMLDELLPAPEYPASKRLFIVDMMRKFELCYDVVPDHTFLVPDLLPKDEPDTGNWETAHQKDGALAFQYHYNVLPSSILTRFIVRFSPFIHHTVWRAGVVLKYGANTALVKADTEDRKVSIWVGGEAHSRRDFLAKIRGEFDAIHRTIIKLEAREKVPIPGQPEAEPVDYDLLMQMEHNSVEVYPVRGTDGQMLLVNVRALLSGVARAADQHRGERVVNIYVGGDMLTDSIKTGNVIGTGNTLGHGAQANVSQHPSDETT